MVKILLSSAVIVLAALTVVGCGGREPGTSDLAIVCGEHVHRADFAHALSQRRVQYRRENVPFPASGSVEFRHLREEIVALLVHRAEYDHAAKKLGIEVKRREIDGRLNEMIRKTFRTRSRFLEQIRSEGVTVSDVRALVRSGIVSEKLEREVTKKIKVSDQDVQRYYRTELPTRFTRPSERTVRQILVRKKDLAEAIVRRLKGGASFAVLARKYSVATSSRLGNGRVTIQRGRTPTAFDRAAFALRVNEVTGPVHTQFGWHVIEALGPVRPARVVRLTPALRRQIREQLSYQRRRAAVSRTLGAMRRECSDVHYARGFAPA